MSLEVSRHSVPLGSPVNRAPPLAVSLFLPPCLLEAFGVAIAVRCALDRQQANRFLTHSALVACAWEPPAECKGKCYTETNQSTEIPREIEFFP